MSTERERLVSFDRELVAVAYYCADREVRARRRAGAQIPYALDRLHNRLNLVIRCASETGHGRDDAGRDLELINSRDAARILRCSKRQAQRLAGDLGAELTGGRWLYQRTTVERYEQQRTEHRNGS